MVANNPRNYVAAWRRYRSLTQQGLANVLGTTKPTVSRLESGKRGLSEKWLKRLAEAFGTEPAQILGPPPEKEHAPHEAERQSAGASHTEDTPAILVNEPDEDYSSAPKAEWRTTPPNRGKPDVPVWASAEAGVDGVMVLVNDPIDWIWRSERLLNVKSPFAFQVIGTSMEPAIEHGDQVVVNPSLLPVMGKNHVFLQTLPDGTILALVKRLLRPGGTAWRVRQHTPPRDFDLPKSKWSKAYVIAEIKKAGL